MSKEIVDLVWGGGVGDTLTEVFTRDNYGYLSTVSKLTEVVFFSVNPHTHEFFQAHPNLKNLNLHSFKNYPQFRKEFDALSAGDTQGRARLKEKVMGEIFGKNFQKHVRCPEKLASDAPLAFYPPVKEAWTMSFYELDQYVILQPFSSAPGRDIPLIVLRDMLEYLTDMNYRVFVLMRKNELQAHQPKNFNPQHYFSEVLVEGLPARLNIYLIDGSIPSVIQAIQSCSLFIGADACFLPAAGYYQRPIYFLTPEENLLKPEIANKQGRYFGLASPQSVAVASEKFQLKPFQEYIQKTCPL